MPIPKTVTQERLDIRLKNIPTSTSGTVGNIDGGAPDSEYGGLEIIDCGEV